MNAIRLGPVTSAWCHQCGCHVAYKFVYLVDNVVICGECYRDWGKLEKRQYQLSALWRA
jgi:hypothetical protein